MRKSAFETVIVATMMATSMGCGGGVASRGALASTTAAAGSSPSGDVVADALATMGGEGEPLASFDPSTLPPAPWAEAPLATGEAPSQLVAAWSRADNRDWCAPLVPRSFGAADGARARLSEVEGGWAVEFDRRGMPGLTREGEECESCGRGVFGVAGTSMTPEELVDVESDRAQPAPSFADGSHSAIESSEGERVAAATVAGQGCVYQVWSFLGAEHVQELVRELRLVEVPQRTGDAALVRAAR